MEFGFVFLQKRKKIVMSVFRSGLFSGKVAIVTGGGTGIGKAIATELLHLGKICNFSELLTKCFHEFSIFLNSEFPRINLAKNQQKNIKVNIGLKLRLILIT